MIKVKTFTNELKIFHTKKEIDDLDAMVNDFIEEKGISQVVSVSDTTTTTEQGTTGIIRVVTYDS